MSYENVARRTWLLTALFMCIVLFLATGCSSARPADDWTRSDTVRELAFQTVNAADAYQTSRIAGRPDLEEGNAVTRAFIGSRPSGGDVAMYFGTLAISHYLIARALPARWRPYFQVVPTVAQGYTVVQNCAEHGLC